MQDRVFKLQLAACEIRITLADYKRQARCDVIPANAGIQYFQCVLDTGSRRYDAIGDLHAPHRLLLQMFIPIHAKIRIMNRI